MEENKLNIAHSDLHQLALDLSKKYKRVESELIDVIQKIDALKLFRTMGFSSLFVYVNKGLGLSESVTYSLINVSRKAQEIPQLKDAIKSGDLSLSQAKRVTSVITKSNAFELIEKAKVMTQRELEKEVAGLNPQEIPKEKTRYLNKDRIELKISLKEEILKKLKRIQDLESKTNKSVVTYENAIESAIEFYLQKNDPVLKSEKILQKLSSRPVNQNQSKSNSFKDKNSVDRRTITKNSEISDSDSDSDSNNNKNINSNSISNENGNGIGNSNEKVFRESLRYEIKSANKRMPIPKLIYHKVMKRDQGQCTQKDLDGNRCFSQRWLEIHHIKEVQFGGSNTLENLTTLCSGHHKSKHLIV